MKDVAFRLRLRARSVAWIAGLAAALSFGAAVTCSLLVQDVLGAQARPCDPPSGQPTVLLAVPELSRAPSNPRFKPEGCVVVSGFWMQDERGEVGMRVVADGAASLAVDGQAIAGRDARSGGRAVTAPVWLDAGAHRFELRFEPEGLGQLKGVVVGEGGARSLDPAFVRAPRPWEYLAEKAGRTFSRLAAACVALWLGALVLAPGAWPPVFAIVAFAALLRFEALIGRYGGGLPGAVATNLFRVGHSLRPDTWAWEKTLVPYAGGDPVHYIDFARAMMGFFDAHVREPLFVAWSRLFIVDLGMGDFGISVASMIASCALVAATYLFAYSQFGRTAAVISALLLAADPAEISLSVEGWRDGAFAASFVLALWGLERARQDPSRSKGAALGAILGASCLLRLSALSYAAPAILALALSGPGPRPRRLAAAGWALAGAVLLLGPYLLSCAIAYGDPLHAVNYHLRYYRPAIGSGAAPPATAASAYIFSLQDPWGRADTLFEGLTSYPFLSKWTALELWFGSATVLIGAASALGLVGFVAFPAGRRILMLTGLALVPFAFTWPVPGGSEYRFTLLAYPVYLAAAGWLVASFAALKGGAAPTTHLAGRTVKALAFAVVLFFTGVALRHARMVADGRAARGFTIGGGPRDGLSATGFGTPYYDDEGFVRTSEGSRRFLDVVLQPARPWGLTFRWKGAERAEVLENGRRVDELPATGGETGERTMQLPASTDAHRRFEVKGGGAFAFLSARFAPEGPERPR
jgi:hypothetical protein